MDFKLTPQDIKNKEFKKMMWGYSPSEVGVFLEMVGKTWEKMIRHEKELSSSIKSLNEELHRLKNRDLEMQKLREKAVQDAEAIRVEAIKEAEKIFTEVEERANGIRVKTEEWLERVISEVEETERQKINFMTAFKAALDSHYALLKNETDDPEPLGAKLNHFLRAAASQSTRTQ